MARDPALSRPPVTPARIVFDPDGSVLAPDFDDRYHPRIGAAAQARHVFLAGNGLPQRWAGESDFCILETGFGLGSNFLATWQAWRDDPARGERLHFASIEAHPPTREDLAKAHAGSEWPTLAAALLDAWPPLTPGLHVLDFDGGRVRLLLALGDVHAMQRQLDLGVDAYFLDGFAPNRNPAMWQPALLRALARKARPGASAATWSVAREVRDGLRAAGFEVERAPGIGGKREITRALYAPRATVRPPALREPPRDERRVLVIGAGLAGAWAANRLAAQSWQVTVLDRHAEPAQESSGNPAGLFHATVHADDGIHARFNRAAAMTAATQLRAWTAANPQHGAVDGLLRLAAPTDTVADMAARARHSGLPDHFVQALSAAQASELAGLRIERPAWHFQQAGWLRPGALVAHLLDHDAIGFRAGADVQALRREGGLWQLLDARAQVIDSAPFVVLANGADASRLWPCAAWPIGRSRGQISWWPSAPLGAPRPRLPIAGDGYALALPDGELLCGATAAHADDDDHLRIEDHRFNVERLARLTGWKADPGAPWQGRVGWRVQTTDRLPIVGPVPASDSRPGDHSAREPGLFVMTALGSRGLTWAPLAAMTLAAWMDGTPMPLESRLRDAIDPARWARRQARRRG